MRAALRRQRLDVVVIPHPLPQRRRQQLIHLLTGKAVPAGRLASTEFGVQCLNVATPTPPPARWSIAGHPAAGDADRRSGAPGNVEALLGAPADSLAGRSRPPGGRRADCVMGGPMMGFALPDASAGLTQASNCLDCRQADAVSAAPAGHAVHPLATQAGCSPAELRPMDLHSSPRRAPVDKARDAHLFDCINAARAAMSCPARFPWSTVTALPKASCGPATATKSRRAPASAMNSASSAWSTTNRKAERLAGAAPPSSRAAGTSHRPPSADDAGKRAAIEDSDRARRRPVSQEPNHCRQPPRARCGASD